MTAVNELSHNDLSHDDMKKFEGNKVIINLPGKGGEMEGKLEAYNEVAGGFFRKKGSPNGTIFELSEVQSIEFAPEKARKLSPRQLPIVEYGKARQHLADRHGITLDWINSVTEVEAFEAHEQLDHSQLGHFHTNETKKERIDRESSVENEGQLELTDESGSTPF